MNRRKLATGEHPHFSESGSPGGRKLIRLGRQSDDNSHWLYWATAFGYMELLWSINNAEATLSGDGL